MRAIPALHAGSQEPAASMSREGGAGGRQHAPGKVAARFEERKLFRGEV